MVKDTPLYTSVFKSPVKPLYDKFAPLTAPFLKLIIELPVVPKAFACSTLISESVLLLMNLPTTLFVLSPSTLMALLKVASCEKLDVAAVRVLVAVILPATMSPVFRFGVIRLDMVVVARLVRPRTLRVLVAVILPVNRLVPVALLKIRLVKKPVMTLNTFENKLVVVALVKVALPACILTFAMLVLARVALVVATKLVVVAFVEIRLEVKMLVLVALSIIEVVAYMFWVYILAIRFVAEPIDEVRLAKGIRSPVEVIKNLATPPVDSPRVLAPAEYIPVFVLPENE